MAVPRQSWHLNDAGILRKKEEDDELLVFGYSCKIFRDDEKALFIDQGKHLIPWMGDESLKIDRYDGRAALPDLRELEAPTGGYDLWATISDAERRVEQLCDEERYRALTHNEEEEALYQEEELKRLQQALSAENTYGQVAYQYDESGQPVGEQKSETTVGGGAVEEDEPFVAPKELDIPLNMVLPETVKANAIIEKTAMFINEQGAQMEILLKMKQARNPQFQFLSFDDPLHTYYRHLLMAIKTGRYRPKPPKEEQEDDDQDDEDDGYYLHPSLASSASRIELAPSIPSINYKPSADCAYSMLVNKIRDKQAAFVAEETAANASIAAAAASAAASSVSAGAQSDLESVEEEDVEEEEGDSGAYPGYRGNRDDAVRLGKGDLVGTGPIIGIGRKRRKRRGARRKRRSSGGMEKGDFGLMAVPMVEPPPEMQIVIDKMASYVAKNGRDFETIVKSKGDPRFAFLDAMHQFNSYYRLRLQQYELQNAPPVTIHETPVPSPAKKPKKAPEKLSPEEKSPNEAKSPEHTKPGNQERESSKSATKLAPVCFSIKKPKEVEILPLDKRSALLLEETSEEEEGGEESEGKVEQQYEETESKVKLKPPAVERVEQSQSQVEAVCETAATRVTHEINPIVEEKMEDLPTHESIIVKQENVIMEKEPVILEGPVPSVELKVPKVEEQPVSKTPTDDLEADKDIFLELGETISPGGLSPASAANRERHLQQERKRKAALFLKMIKKEHPPDVPPKSSQPLSSSDPISKTASTVISIVDDDDDTYSSIPSPVVTISKVNIASTGAKKDEWNYPSPGGAGQNGLTSYSSREKSYRKIYPSENDGRENSPCHRRHHHHHHGHKHKHRKDASPLSPSRHKRARSTSRSRSKTRSDRPRKEGSSYSKHKKGKKKKARSRSRSRGRRPGSSSQSRHHHKKTKHHSRHKGKRREREDFEVSEDYHRRHRSRSREKYKEKRKTPENILDEGQGGRKRREESTGGSSNERSSGSESSDSRDSAR